MEGVIEEEEEEELQPGDLPGQGLCQRGRCSLND